MTVCKQNPFALPVAQITVQTQEGSGWLAVVVLQDIRFDWEMTASL